MHNFPTTSIKRFGMNLHHTPNGLDIDGDTPYIGLEGEDSLGLGGQLRQY
jgi:hypothetical protein